MTGSAAFTAAVGFDGYVDRIVRIVSDSSASSKTFFKDIPRFASAVESMAGKSGDLEFVTEMYRPGGCAPILAGALAGLGADVTLIGTISHDVFKSLHPRVRQVSYGDPSDSLDFEFDDGKIMLADIAQIHDAVMSIQTDRALMDALKGAYATADICILTNWSCIPEMYTLWEIAISEIRKRGDRPVVYMDLADFSKRSSEDVHKLVDLINTVSGLESYLGVNEKEAFLLTKKMGATAESVQEASEFVREAVGCDVVTHGIGYCVYTGKSGQLTVEGKIAEHPIVSTGAGDNFNAAWCYATMSGFPKQRAMEFANQFSYDFVRGIL